MPYEQDDLTKMAHDIMGGQYAREPAIKDNGPGGIRLVFTKKGKPPEERSLDHGEVNRLVHIVADIKTALSLYLSIQAQKMEEMACPGSPEMAVVSAQRRQDGVAYVTFRRMGVLAPSPDPDQVKTETEVWRDLAQALRRGVHVAPLLAAAKLLEQLPENRPGVVYAEMYREVRSEGMADGNIKGTALPAPRPAGR